MMTKNDNFKGSLEMTASMVIAGTVGYFVVMSKQDPQMVVFWRCFLGAMFMAIVCFAKGLHKIIRFDKRLLTYLGIGGIALAFNWLFLFKAYSLSSISIATIVYHVEPFILIAFGFLFFGEKIGLNKVLWLVLAFIGAFLIITGKQSKDTLNTNSNYIVGVLFALLAAFCYAVCAAITKKLKDTPPHIIVAFQLFIGALVLFPLAPVDAWSEIPLFLWLLLATIGFVHTGLMCLFLYSAIQKIPTALIGAISFIYPVVAVIVDWFAFDNTLNTIQILGSLAILVAAAGTTLNWSIKGRVLRFGVE